MLDTQEIYNNMCELESLQNAIDGLKEELKELQEEIDEKQEEISDAIQALKDFEESCGYTQEDIENTFDGIKRWKDVVFITESDFPRYVRTVAEDCQDIPTGWPFNCIDWDRAADELQLDYSSLDWQGESYLYQD